MGKKMISIDYSLDIPPSRENESRGLASATLSDITGSLFAGDVLFRVDDVSFDAAWGWVPVLDFAIAIYDIPRQIQDGGMQTFTFLENADSLRFRRDGQSVEVTTTYTDASARVDLIELTSASRSFMLRVFRELSARWPDLASNPVLVMISEVVHSDDSLPIEPVILKRLL